MLTYSLWNSLVWRGVEEYSRDTTYLGKQAGTCGVERKGFIFLQLEYFQSIIATSTEFSVKLTRSLARLMIDSPTTTRRMMVSMEGDQNTRHGVIGLSVWV